MDLGNKILNLRKKFSMTQEQLAEKLNVTRQTISKWELNETTPDIKQACELSKLFNVSLDELLNNSIQNVLIDKLSNTEKLAGIIIKILKGFGIAIIGWIILCIAAFICFTVFRKEKATDPDLKSATITCKIEDANYNITIGANGYFNCDKCTKQMEVYLKDITDWANLTHGIENIKTYFAENGGTCQN